jgi:tRNA (guanine26-N2/guanine27-N2)-dimethyltransferase
LNAGYKVSTSHARQDAIKTNAPHAIIWDIMRAFAEQSSTKRAATERLHTDSPYYRLLTKTSTIQVDFTEHPDWESEARKNKLIRFMGNPHARWGPIGKAVAKTKRSIDDSDCIQNKKQVETTLLLLYTSFVCFQLFFRQCPIMNHQLKKICEHFSCCLVKVIH